jgi:Mg-chelatase subunit ChlD
VLELDMKIVLSVGAFVAFMAIASCGSRTELDDLDTTNGSSNSNDGSTSDAGDASETSVGCTPGDIPLSAAEPEVMFVLDRSGSMNTEFSGTQSRWQVLTTALAATLPPVDQSMEIGALVFPSGTSNDNCSVPSSANISPALGQVTPLLNLLQSTTPGGATPTADAIDSAAALMLELRAATSARALVLATDGAPNCNSSLDPSSCTCAGGTQGRGCRNDPDQCLDDTRTVSRITAAASEGIPTYVIGIADANDSIFSGVLNAMAQAGGRPLTGEATSYYPARSQSDLESALTTIRDQVGACTYLTTSVPDSSGSISLTLDGVVIPYDPTGKTGWSWADESNGQILLFGSTCLSVAAATNPDLVAHVVCDADAGSDASVDASDDSAVDASDD